jgi:hypothetical protein
MPEHAAALDNLIKGYVKEPEAYGPPDQLTWFLKSQVNATKAKILAELGIVPDKKKPDKRELIGILRHQFLDVEELNVEAVIQRCTDFCTLKGIATVPFVAATLDQLNPMSTATEDTLSFHSAPQRQDAIEMLSNCEWDVERAESLGLTKPIAP